MRPPPPGAFRARPPAAPQGAQGFGIGLRAEPALLPGVPHRADGALVVPGRPSGGLGRLGRTAHEPRLHAERPREGEEVPADRSDRGEQDPERHESVGEGGGAGEPHVPFGVLRVPRSGPSLYMNPVSPP
ncbi:hypothetical protein GCM10010363_31100 [Streptomyces omiyaensis]|nr:hypothetical protein GCM10010363_31100 [Streptomyces omiyaensis]